MSAKHLVLEVKTTKNSEFALDRTYQFLSTLPELHQRLYHRLLDQTEHLGLEIAAFNQNIHFFISAPERVIPYLINTLTANYKEVVVLELANDPVKELSDYVATSQGLLIKNLKLKNQSYLPLKTYQDFKETDPLASVLAMLSQLGEQEQVVIQFLIKNHQESWKSAGVHLLSAQPDHPQKTLINKKISGAGLSATIRFLVNSPDQNHSRNLLQMLSAAFGSLSESEGNKLVLARDFWPSKWKLKPLLKRQFGFSPQINLNLAELTALYHLPNQKLAHIPNIAWGKKLLGEPPENLPIISSNQSPEQKKDINPFAKTWFKNQTAVYGLKTTDRRRHLYVIGKTGTGKSTMLANMAINDLKNDQGLCVIDPHGDLVETLLNYIPSHRINDVVYFDPSDPERTVKINLFEGKNVVHRELIASGIVSIFQKLYAYSWGPRLEYILRNALLTLLKSEQARMSDIVELLTDAQFRARVIDKLDDPILKSFWTMEFDKMSEKLRNEAISPILNKVGQFVSSPLVRNVVNAHKSSFNIEDIMNQGKILLVNLSQGRLGEDNATLLGAMLITKIQLSAMGRVQISENDRRDFYLYVDEFQNFATGSFIKILSEARKYRLNLILANQYIAQIPEEVQKAIFGNCGSIVSFVMGADDASVFTKEYGDKYTSEDLVSLDRYQIINKISIDNVISSPFPGLTLPLAKSSNLNRDKVIKVSRERYATKR